MADNIQALSKKLQSIAKKIPHIATTVIEVEGTNFIKDNFDKEGFQDGSLKKWQPRKTTDKQGRELTRYRTNRVGRMGSLTKFGRHNQPGRPILTGFNSGGNKLRHSLESTKDAKGVTWRTYKPYAERHNEGLKGMPKRQFIGKSKTLEQNIERMLAKQLDKIFK